MSTTLLILSGCATLNSERCNLRFAEEQGFLDATLGNNAKPGRALGTICEQPYSPSDYIRDYEAGFDRGWREICDPELARRFGEEDGNKGYVDRPSFRKLSVCTGAKSESQVIRAYHKAFEKKFCRAEVIEKLGESLGMRLELVDEDSVLNLCPGPKKTRLSRAYRSAYERAVQKKCTIPNIFSQAVLDAANGTALEKGVEPLNRCPTDEQALLLGAYINGFNEGLQKKARANGNDIATPVNETPLGDPEH